MSDCSTHAYDVPLKPCPFCKSEAFVRVDTMLHPTQSRYRVGCDKDSNCHGWYGHSRYYSTEAEAVTAWNTRHQCGLTDEDYNILLDELGVSERTEHGDECASYCPRKGEKEKPMAEHDLRTAVKELQDHQANQGGTMSGDICKTVTLYVVVQENGIIRDDKGWIVGRANDEWMRYNWRMLESGVCPCCGRQVVVE